MAQEASMEVAGRIEIIRKSGRLGARGQAGIALVALAAIYLLINRGPARGGDIETHVVQPLLWSGLAALVLLLSRLGDNRLSFAKALVPLALLCGAFHLSLLLTGGMLAGFGHSPLSHAPLDILRNLSWVLSSLLALELTRAYLLGALGRERPVLAVAATALLFAFVSVSLAKITSLDGGPAATRFLGRTGLPILSENLLASYLALLGGPLPAIAYRGVLAAFQWLSPVLPDLPVVSRALLGTLGPVIGVLAVQSVCAAEPAAAEATKPRRFPLTSGASWVLVSIAGVAIAWFSLGMFPVFPLVATGSSMSPTLRHGDLAIVREVSGESVEEGDVIRYRSESAWVLHRVVEVHGEAPSRVFTTQGDNNNVPDPEPVAAEDIEGELLFSIPKLGHIGFGMKRLFGLLE